jgi:nitrite reductase/ring-hydroxylating ferredoxin subunit
MITPEESDLLTRTGRGTPCGELMRRYWQPAAISEELTADKPLPVQLFGEELILFRDGSGKPALIGRYCAHQGVDLIYGRVEPDGIRCMYHGWLFDACGKVIVRAGWVEGGEKRMEVGQPAYPCAETGGFILAYMGPGEPSGVQAQERFLDLQACVEVKKNLHAENFFQGILNANERPGGATFVLPNLVIVSKSSPAAVHARWHVPVDDTSHMEFIFRYHGKPPVIGDPLEDAHQVLLQAMEVARSGESPGDRP